MRRVQCVLLCEDRQHEAFVRRFLRGKLDIRDIRVLICPPGQQAAEQWVRMQYPREVRALRRNQVATSLVVMIDGDLYPIPRLQILERALSEESLSLRSATEPIAIFVPKRNIETWIAYLNGQTVDEQTTYPKLQRQRDCRSAVDILKQMCEQNHLRQPCPPSLQEACEEYQKI